MYRTACKTSPFSTFTGVALGSLTGTDGLRLRVDEEWRAQARLNVVALGRLADAVIADPARRADLPVAPASGWGRDDGRVRYVRRWVTAGDDDTAVTFDAVRDRLFFLRRSGTLDRLLGLFEERRGSVLRYGELVEWLARDQGAAREECEQYLGALLDVGMVQVPCLRTEVHDTDPLRAFQGALGAWSAPGPTGSRTGWRGPPGASSGSRTPRRRSGARCWTPCGPSCGRCRRRSWGRSGRRCRRRCCTRTRRRAAEGRGRAFRVRREAPRVTPALRAVRVARALRA